MRGKPEKISVIVWAFLPYTSNPQSFKRKQSRCGLPWWAQWRTHLAGDMDPWPGKIPYATGQTRPVRHSSWACALEPRSPSCWGPRSQSLCRSKPLPRGARTRSQGEAPARRDQGPGEARRAMKSSQPQTSKQTNKLKKSREVNEIG